MFSVAYKRYALANLFVVYTVSGLDIGLLTILLQPIKEDLRISDTQIGILTGIAFALFNTTLGLPIARWADRGNRVTLTALASGLWGLSLMSCLFVTSYPQLLLARVVAAIVGSGVAAPTYSLLGDYFPDPAERVRAMYIYQAAAPVTVLVSNALGGWLNELYGWRMTFFIMGAPAILLALLIQWTLIEPRTQARSTRDASLRRLPPFKEVLATIWLQPSCRHLMIALTVLFTMSDGLGPWYAAFMMRSHGMGTAELGAWMGSAIGLGGLLGTLLGRFAIGHWFGRTARGQMRLAAGAIAATTPFFLIFLTVPNGHLALIALLPQVLVISVFFTPVWALLQRLVPETMRATVFMGMTLFASFIGMGIGPQIVGTLSDLLSHALGAESLRYAMLVVSFLGLWASYHFWRLSQTIEADLINAERSLLPVDQATQEFAAVTCTDRAR